MMTTLSLLQNLLQINFKMITRTKRVISRQVPLIRTTSDRKMSNMKKNLRRRSKKSLRK